MVLAFYRRLHVRTKLYWLLDLLLVFHPALLHSSHSQRVVCDIVFSSGKSIRSLWSLIWIIYNMISLIVSAKNHTTPNMWMLHWHLQTSFIGLWFYVLSCSSPCLSDVPFLYTTCTISWLMFLWWIIKRNRHLKCGVLLVSISYLFSILNISCILLCL